jgi:hypothetical protein
VRNAVTSGYKAVAEPVTNAVTKGISTALDTGLAPYSMDRPARAIAETVVPQTPLQAGAMIGTGGAGALAARAGLGPGLSALARITGGAVGGEAGGQVSGAPTGKGALVGGTGALTGEAIGNAPPLLVSAIAIASRSCFSNRSTASASEPASIVPVASPPFLSRAWYL